MPWFTDKLHTDIRCAKIPNTTVSAKGQRAIRRYLEDHGGFRLPRSTNWKWETTNIHGTITKRISKHVKTEYACNLSKEDLAEIGSIARLNCPKKAKHYLRFRDEFDWDRGDFGDPESCYFTCHAGAMEMLRDNGAWVAQFFSDEDPECGIGRCWMAPMKHRNKPPSIFLYNGYGPNGDAHLTVYAQVLSHHLGLETKEVQLRNQDCYEGELWINGGTGHALGTSEEIAEICENDYYDLAYPEIRLKTCRQCEIKQRAEELMFDDRTDYYFCEDCWPYSNCHNCCDTFHGDDLMEVHNQLLCYDCTKELYIQCPRCLSWTDPDDMKPFNQPPNPRYSNLCPECTYVLQEAKAYQEAEETNQGPAS